MNTRPKLRLPNLAAALAATAVTAWAAYDSSLVPSYDPPSQTVLEARPLNPEVPAVVANHDGLTANEEIVTVTETPIAPRQQLAPVSEIPPREPAITIEQQRLTLDERIQADVIDLLARNPNLSGKIGVVTQDAVVTLTGYTTTSGQAWRAGRDARGVQGVRHVVNEIRPRVGAITS